MTLTEFKNKYYLHDSSIDKIEYDEDNHTLRLEIDFCFWMQNWYKDGEPSNGIIAVTFTNVSYYEYEDYDPSKLFSDFTPDILQTEIDDDGTLIIYTFEFVRYEPGEDLYPIMRIRADKVIVNELSRYDYQPDSNTF